jgi:hypothetical protein
MSFGSCGTLVETGRPIAAACHGPQLLIEAETSKRSPTPCWRPSVIALSRRS